MDYPDSCLRGIPNSANYVNPGGSIGSNLFYFTDAAREDAKLAVSVNWEDDGNVESFILSQQKPNGELQFGGGVARLSRQHIEHVMAITQLIGLLSYEREPLPNNNYHGNILLNSGTEIATMKQIAASLALGAQLPAD